LQTVVNGTAQQQPEDFVNAFQSFSQDPFRPVLWLLVFLFLTHFIVVKGVKDGIEKSSKIFMPVLFILIVVLAICSMSLPNAGKGLEFLLKPDFSKVNADVFLGAMGQAFFSLSLGMGCLSTYASYFGSDTQLGKTALSVGVIDSMVAILAGLIIFPAAFSVGIQPDAGPSLIFITLPNVFQQAFGGVPILAAVFSLMFYILLALAALTSTISLHEVVTAYLSERFDLKRSRAALFVTGFCVVTGIMSSLSLGVWEDKFFGLGFFDLLDFVTAKMMLPLNGLLVCLFVGWYLKKSLSRDELTNGGTLRAPYYPLYMLLLRYVVPVAILLIMINELGFI
jgi:NSS family neurotransmitter:Na+ symporter